MATQACPYLYFDDVVKAIDWFNKVAQFETLTRVDDSDGRVKHVELSLGPVVIMLGDPGKGNLSEHGFSTGSVYIVMKDEDALTAHFEHAKQQDSASIDKEPFKTDYGSLDYSLKYKNQHLYFGTYAPEIKKATT